MTKSAAGNTRTENTFNSRYLGTVITTCQMITLSVSQVRSVPEPTQTSLQTEMLPRSPDAQSPMCLKNYYYPALFHCPTPHQAPTSAISVKLALACGKEKCDFFGYG